VADVVERLEAQGPVVEFGSLQVEPDQDADLRPLFPGRAFTGTDMRAGPGVDRVEDLRALSFSDGEVGTALCLDTLEHCEDPVAACREIHRVVGEGGLCIISSVMLFGVHGYPNDYFRFTPEGFRSMLSPFDDCWVRGVGDPEIPTQVVGVATKGRAIGADLDNLPSLDEAQQRWELAVGRVRVGPFRVPWGELAGIVAREAVRNASLGARSIVRRRGTRDGVA